jgi:release factor glutamine methyltransferase
MMGADNSFAEAVRRLEGAGVGEAVQKARWVFGAAYECGLLDAERRARAGEAPRGGWGEVERMLSRVEGGEPVQYAVGECDFLDFTVKCDRRALIPRPETEEWVAAALEELEGAGRIADVCTGNGCIAAAVARRFPEARVVATDLSAEALELARKNFARLGVSERVETRHCDLLGARAEDAGTFAAVLSNPPYIASAVCGTLEPVVRDFEPRLALDGGEDGLKVISRLAEEAGRVLQSGGRFWCEIGEDQGAAVETILWKTNQFKEIRVRCDFAGRARLAAAVRR